MNSDIESAAALLREKIVGAAESERDSAEFPNSYGHGYDEGYKAGLQEALDTLLYRLT